MRSVTYSVGVSLDGYVVGPNGEFDWTAPFPPPRTTPAPATAEGADRCCPRCNSDGPC
jgi:hypothetical protein